MEPLFGQADQEHSTWTVGDLTAYIRELFELDYRLQDVRVEGEISNFTQARSGHLYFTLKDENAQLKCVMWRSNAERLRFRPSDGDAIVARGHISVYEVGGVYQLYTQSLSPTGRGDLALAFERLKQRLAEEGLFDPEHKQPLPRFPRKIGVVTSADAAALRDILNVLRRRSPFLSVLIAPALVQGDAAPNQIVRSLQWLDARDDVDTIIVARGGGSIEDLWAFNDEGVVRAIFAAHHPVISGVGHETDFTIADFVADVRAPTPSAAAELAAPDVAELRPHVQTLGTAVYRHMQTILEQERWQVQSLVRSLRHLGPQARLAGSRQQVDGLTGRLEQAIVRHLERRRGRLDMARARLNAVGPLATLSRGYAIVRREDDGRIVRSVGDVTAGDQLRVRVADGSFDAAVESQEKE